MIYKCLACRRFYGHDSRLPHLKPVDPATDQRYADCNVRQDTRDIQPFLGLGGGGQMRAATEEEVYFLLNPHLQYRPGLERIYRRD